MQAITLLTALCSCLPRPPLQMDTQGNLFNFYNDIGGERKITPVRG